MQKGVFVRGGVPEGLLTVYLGSDATTTFSESGSIKIVTRGNRA